MKKPLKIAGIVVLAVVVVGLIVWAVMSQPGSNNNSSNTGNKVNSVAGVPDAMLEDQTPEAAQATQDLINDLVTDGGQEMQTIQTSETVPGTEGVDGEMASSTIKEIKMVVVSPGTSGINVETGKVITATGDAVANDVRAGSQEAPQSSFPIDAAELPKSSIKLAVTSNSFTPAEFTVNRGQAVNLAVTNANESTFSEVFRFDEPSLKGVVLGLAKGETRSITFNAPDKAGEYTFFSDMFDHRAQGAVGKMIVK